MSDFNLGRFLLNFRGEYNSTSLYQPLDVVLYNGSSYVSKTTNSGRQPTGVSSAYWILLAAKGSISPTLLPEQVDAIIQQITSETSWVSDSNYVHTDNNFTNTHQEAVENIGDGYLTIQRNGVTLNSISMNSKNSKVVNISVPTTVDDLGGSSKYIVVPEVIDYQGTEIDIDITKSNTVYICDKLDNVTLSGNLQRKEMWLQQPIFVEFDTGNSGATIDNNTQIIKLDIEEINLEPNLHYVMKIQGTMCQVIKLY